VIDLTKIPSPCYVIEEELLRNNLQLIRSVKDRTGIDIILAFKAFAVWKSFPVFREYGIDSSTASSVNEARLAFEEMGSPAHAYSPSYTDENLARLVDQAAPATPMAGKGPLPKIRK